MSPLRPFLIFVSALVLAACASGCKTISMAAADQAVAGTFHGPPADPPPVTAPPSVANPSHLYETTVANLSGEDLAGPCNYYLYLSNPSASLRGVFVIFDRSDSRYLFGDPPVESFAGAINFGLLFPQQCDAGSFGDIQQNAFAGPGRALFTALDQFATQLSHPELTNSNVVLFGFSAAGVLAATTANYKPSRVIGVIAYDGASAEQQLNTVVPSQAVLQIPFLVLSNDQDGAAGTSRDQIFFEQGWKKTAPWAYGVQHGVGHCCAISTEPLILPWISAVVAQRLGPAGQLDTIAEGSTGVFDNYTCTPNGIEDVTGYENCTFSAASLIAPGSSIAKAQGWLPDAATGAAWLNWVGL